MPVRRATAADVPAVERIVRAAFSVWVDRIGRAPGPMLADYATVVDQLYVTADDPPAGVLQLVPEPDGLLLEVLAVDPGAQGAGLGTALLRFTEAEAVRRGLPRVRLETNVLMTENRAFYARRGYTESGPYEVHGYQRVQFTKPVG